MQALSMMPMRCGSAALGAVTVMTQTASGACTGADVGAGTISGVLMVARGACSTRKVHTTAQPLMFAGEPYAVKEQALAPSVAVLTGCASTAAPTWPAVRPVRTRTARLRNVEGTLGLLLVIFVVRPTLQFSENALWLVRCNEAREWAGTVARKHLLH